MPHTLNYCFMLEIFFFFSICFKTDREKSETFKQLLNVTQFSNLLNTILQWPVSLKIMLKKKKKEKS